MAELARSLEGTRWRGIAFWYVTTIGGHDPYVVATQWSLIDVHDAYFDLQMRAVMEQ